MLHKLNSLRKLVFVENQFYNTERKLNDLKQSRIYSSTLKPNTCTELHALI